MGQIIITINKDKILTDEAIEIEGVGYTGSKCVQDIDALMRELEATTISQRTKSEYCVATNKIPVRRS